MFITALPAFTDNYFWLLADPLSRDAIVVDPGDADVVLTALAKSQLTLRAILITHHHADHIGGLNKLIGSHHHSLKIFAPEKERGKISAATDYVQENSSVDVGFCQFKVMELPGHTLGHIAYYDGKRLFCGDTLFAGGCGRVFEGTMQQMFSSLEKIKSLPTDTEIYCAHEYTLSNLRFALTVEPNNLALQKRFESVKQLRANNQATVPSVLAEELATNPFLRCDSVEVFSHLRRLKDQF